MMMAHKQLLHELLKEDQEPFQLHTYIAERRSQLKLNIYSSSPVTTLQVKSKKREHVFQQTSPKQSSLCFFAPHHHSPEVRTSPFVDFPSPEMSTCKSSAGAVFLTRIQKHPQSKMPKSEIKSAGSLGLFGSFLRILKHRSNNKNRAIGDKLEIKGLTNDKPKEERKTEELDVVINGNLAIRETRFCSSPLRFSLRKTPPPSGRRTPDICSPVASPIGHVNKEKENYTTVEEEKEQCSPVSVLDPFLEDDERESIDADYNLDRSYANIQRARQKLLDRLRRFEKLAELDPLELEKKLLETSDDDEYEKQSVESEIDEPPLPSVLCRKQVIADTLFVNKQQVFSQSNLHQHDINRNLTDEMIELDFKKEFDRWNKFSEQAEETAADLELAIFGALLEELISEEFVLA